MNDLEILNQCFEPDFENGILYFKERPREHFINQGGYTRHLKQIGKIAGSTCISLKDNEPRYYREIVIYVKGSKFRRYLHRSIYMMYHNIILPSTQLIDHVDGNGLNNSINNLRLCTRAQNSWNSKRGTTRSMTGYKNVYRKNEKEWDVRITKLGKLYSFGSYDTIEEANEVACRERARLFGEFANDA